MSHESLKISEGFISVSDVEFLNGTIEADINFPQARFFPSIRFRMQNEQNTENFYIRPHQSGNPDAAQYTPVFNGESGWQLYHGEGYSQAAELEPDTWHHIRINVLGNEADIYFDDMETPLIKVTDLKRAPEAGKIGLSTGSPVHFANFEYSLAKPELADRDTTQKETPQGLITEWMVSNIVKDDLYQDMPEINVQNLDWTFGKTESSGTINLARFVQRSEGMNTGIAKLNVTAEETVQKQVVFGCSDFVWIYVNGKQIYGGRNDFRSRDYRYLGTIGFFDSLHLPLNEGTNEVLFVVGENFGCGSGFQSIAISSIGFNVTAVDFNQYLLDELTSRDENGTIDIIKSDILSPENYSHYAPFELAVCMGDTLPHLPSEESVSDFFRIAYDLLEPNGNLILSFRDYSIELSGVDRFIPVQNEQDKIMTVFLEYESDYVFVHDLVYEERRDGWELEKSVYKKVRLSADQVKNLLQEANFSIDHFQLVQGMVHVIATK